MSRRSRSFLVATIGVALLTTTVLGGEPVILNSPRAMPGNPAVTVPAPPPNYQPAPAPAYADPSCATHDSCPVDCGPSVQCLPSCGPRVRLFASRPQIIYRTTRERRVVEAESCPAEPAPCTTSCTTGGGFGAAPSRPQQPGTTTVHVPYTYWVPVPTFAMMPQQSFGGFGAVPSGFGAAPMGFGAVQTAGFTANTAATGFGSAGSNMNEAAIRAALAALLKSQGKDGGFGGVGDDSCKKDIAELAARVDKLRSDLDEFRKISTDTQTKLTEAVGKSVTDNAKIVVALKDIADTLERLNKKVGDGPDGKSLTQTMDELNKRLEKLKEDNKLK